VRSLLRSLRRTYLSVDPRSLGLFRIAFGVVLLSDLVRRFVELPYWYTNSGLLPNHTLLWRPPASHVFSLFYMASTVNEARLGFALCGLVYLGFTLGYRTRALQFLALACRISLNSRLAMLENGGDMVMNLLALFTLALPLGQRFSIDAWLAGSKPKRPVHSLAMLGLILQFSAIYFFNALSKDGVRWRDGSAVHYALHLDKYNTAIGVWMRDHLSASMLQGLAWGTLVIEWTAFTLLFTPFFVDRARGVAVVVLPLLHTSFALALSLGGFSPAMISFYPLLLSDKHWDALERAWASRPRLVRLAQRATALRDRLQPLAAAVLRPARAPRFARTRRWAAEACVAALIAAIATQIINDNTSVPGWMRVHQPEWAQAIIEYPRLLQGWRMFAPNPPENDTMLYVDAVTSEGRHVDPYNLVASRFAFPADVRVPARMEQSQYFTMYSDRIAMKEYEAYRQAFLEWLIAFPERTHRPSDCLLSLDVFYVTDRSPDLGSRTSPTPVDRVKVFSYVAPASGTCRPVPPRKSPQRSREVALNLH
jgi:Vitamin K-dependent gamma-carboxylase